MVKPAAFLLVKTTENAYNLLETIKAEKLVMWANAVFGPYQLIAYIESEDEKELIVEIEKIRTIMGVQELDARMVKVIPKDEELSSFVIEKPESAVLLINVDYREEKERVITWNLRKLKGVKWARAMWGPADIIAIVEAEDHEAMRNLICDDVKVMKGIKNNSTFYCYQTK